MSALMSPHALPAGWIRAGLGFLGSTTLLIAGVLILGATV